MQTSTWFYDQQKLLHTALHFQMPTLSVLPIDTFSKCGMGSVLNVLVSGCCTSAKTQPPHKMPPSVTKQQQQKKWPSTANLYFHRGKTTRRLITLHRHVNYCSWRCVFAHEIGSQGTWRISIKISINGWLRQQKQLMMEIVYHQSSMAHGTQIPKNWLMPSICQRWHRKA